MRRKSMTLVFIFAAVMLIGYCAWQIVTTLQERHLSKQEYENTRESYVSAIQPKEKTEGTAEEPAEEEAEEDYYPQLMIDINGLLEQNGDFVAWLYYEDANISYPIVQEKASEINKYMNTTFEGKSNPSGCIFIPYDADPAFRYMNTFVYGHNMANGTMFGTLKKVYENPADCLNPYFYIWTKDHMAIRYRVFAAYVIDKNDSMFAIPLTDEAYHEYINDALSKGAMNQYILFTVAEKEMMKSSQPIVTLSTCYGPSGTPKRLVVQGVEIERRTVEN